MSDYLGKNIFEKIGKFIPGYKGYSEREGRRDTDKLLRVDIAKRLDHMKETINDVIRQQMEKKDLESIKNIDRLKRNLDIVANQVRYANYGESGFFDVVQINTSDLDKLYQYDLGIKQEVEQLEFKIKALMNTENLKEDSTAIISILSILSEKMTNRDKVIMEVK
ncbi:MAG: hypothetical protein BWX92_03309 [Deltaproteobacteria bacterium ADurb.Bin135]|nr:MAG: hypothetical protein BWX92_03309 [Deltaproteobacteria bacterium ADurb.Bin135]